MSDMIDWMRLTGRVKAKSGSSTGMRIVVFISGLSRVWLHALGAGM